MDTTVFFSTEGLTITSANHVADLAKEWYEDIEAEVKALKFYTTTVGLLGSGNRDIIEEGNPAEDLKNLPVKLAKITKAKNLISWLREAIKAHKSLIETLDNLGLSEYCTLKGIERPVRPEEERDMTETEYYSKMEIKQYNAYLSLKNALSTLSIVHPEGALSDAKDELKRVIRKPHTVMGSGRDSLLYNYTPTVNVEDVDNTFFALQQEFREKQANLNAIKHEVTVAVEKANAEKHAAYAQAYSEYAENIKTLQAELKVYKDEQMQNICSLKIVIPDALQGIYKEINSLGKK